MSRRRKVTIAAVAIVALAAVAVAAIESVVSEANLKPSQSLEEEGFSILGQSDQRPQYWQSGSAVPNNARVSWTRGPESVAILVSTYATGRGALWSRLRQAELAHLRDQGRLWHTEEYEGVELDTLPTGRIWCRRDAEGDPCTHWRYIAWSGRQSLEVVADGEHALDEFRRIIEQSIERDDQDVSD